MKYFEFGLLNYQNNEIVSCEYDGKLKQLKLTRLKTGGLIWKIQLTTTPQTGTLKFWYLLFL